MCLHILLITHDADVCGSEAGMESLLSKYFDELSQERAQKLSVDEDSIWAYIHMYNHNRSELESQYTDPSQVQTDYLRYRNEMVKRYLRLTVYELKKRYASSPSFPDLIQEGNLALLKAIDRYDPQRGFKFSTYVTSWIQKAALRYDYQDSTVRVPVYRESESRKIERLKAQGATIQEAAEHIGVSTSVALNIEQIPRTSVPIEHSAPIPIPEIGIGYDLERLRSALNILPPRSREIVKLYYGLEEGSPQTYHQIGDRYRISRERVRQIVKESVQTLREVLT